MNMNKELYGKYVKARVRKSTLGKDCLWAFSVGGLICAIAELLKYLYGELIGIPEEQAGTLTSVSIVFIAVVLTVFGIFDRIAEHAGGGTLVPITGFANAVASPAIDSRSEGLVLGIGTKIFSVAGPVLLYATLSGAIYGAIYWVIGLFY